MNTHKPDFVRISIQFPIHLEPFLEREDTSTGASYSPAVWLGDAEGQMITSVRPKPRASDQTGALTAAVSLASRYRQWMDAAHEKLIAALDADASPGTSIVRTAGLEVLRAGSELKEVTLVVYLMTPSGQVFDRVQTGTWLLMPNEELEAGIAYVVNHSRSQIATCEGVLDELSRLIPAWSEMEEQLDDTNDSQIYRAD
jgi:hypothetical protein